MNDLPVITAYNWVPDFAKGLVRDLRVRWAFEEVGQRYEVRYLDQGDQKAPTHRALQPFGQVPTLQHGDLTLFESGAIVLHIAERWPGLLPNDAAGRARATEWMIAALNTVEPPIGDYALTTLFEADQPWSKARLPLVEARIRERLHELSAYLGEADWLDGAFSVGDLMMITALRQLRDSTLVAEQPNLAAYVARGEARPAFRRALDGQMAGFTADAPAGFAEIRQEEGESQ